MAGPDPDTTYPMPGFPQICFLKNIITRPNIEIGDYTYYDDPDGVSQFEDNVLYHFPFIGDRLRIGKFCAIARGVKFIMNGANHQMNGISSYPFFIFGNGWETARPVEGELPYKGDTIIGSDVWIGLRHTHHAWSTDRRWRHHRCALGCHCRHPTLRHRRRQSGTCRPAALRFRFCATAIGNRLVGSPCRMDRPAPRPDPGRGR